MNAILITGATGNVGRPLVEQLADAGVEVRAVTRHPAAAEFPQLWGSSRAFAQAAWRHLLFGTVLGEFDRRLNPPDFEPSPIDPAAAASNGHGSAEYVVSLN